MYELNCELEYDNRIDKEVIGLCNAMNALPAIETFASCCGHGNDSFRIWFKVMDAKEGLFFLTRCVDKRYWKYGCYWKLELTVGDIYENGCLPIHYMLHSREAIGIPSYEQAKSLVENMNNHLNHQGFMEGYSLNIDDFNVHEQNTFTK